MKKLLLFNLSLLFLITAPAQDMDYNGPAKTGVKSFWDAAAIVEKSLADGGSSSDESMIEVLAYKIIIARQRDRGYNTAVMEAKVKTLKDSLAVLKKKSDDEQAGNKNKVSYWQLKANKVSKLLASLFDTGVGDHTPVNIKTKTEAVKKSTQELVGLDVSNSKDLLARYSTRLKKTAVEAQGFYPGLEKNTKERTDATQVEVDYYMFQYYQAYWDAAQKIFPGETSFSNTYSLATKTLDGFGSVNNLLTLTAKNNEQQIRNTRLPVAKLKDAALEKLFTEAYNKLYSESFKGKALKAIVVSDDWQIQRNEVTGIVTGRLRKGAIVYKNIDGKCFLIQEFFIQQEYVGNSFVGTKSVYAVGKGQEMLCENIK